MGFAAEIKEFLGAAKETYKLMGDSDYKEAQTKYTNVKTAAEQKEMDDPLNQQLKEAKLAHEKATTANIGKGAAASEWQRWLMKQAAAPPPPSPAVGGIPDQSPASVHGSGIAVPPRPDPNAEPAPLMKKGGLAQKFAVGGVVEDDDLDPDPDIADMNAVRGVTPQVTQPAVGPATAPVGDGGYDVGAQRKPAVGAVPTPRPKPPALEAVSDALKYGLYQVENTGAVGPARTQAQRAMAVGAGAAPANEMLQIFKKIDPTGKKYTEGERNLVALQALHDYKMRANQPEEAAKVAFQMLQHFKTAQTQYGALTAAAMKGGHVDEGIKLALKQYANIPDGNNMEMWRDEKSGRIGWQVTTKDENGKDKEVAGGLATPEEIGSNAARLATPGGYENYLGQMLSGAKIKGDPGGAPARGKKEETGDREPPKAAEYKELKQEQINTTVDDWVKANKESPEGKKSGKELTPQEITATKNMLYHLRRNNDITDDQGLQRIQTILSAPDPKKGETPAFKVIENKEDKSRTIAFPDGGELVVPDNQFGMFRTARLEAQKQRADAAAKAIEDAKPGAVGKAVGKAGELLLHDSEGPGQAIKAAGQAIAGPGGLGGVYEGAKKAAGAVGSAAGEFGKDFAQGLAVTHPAAAAAIRNPNTLSPDAVNPDDRPL